MRMKITLLLLAGVLCAVVVSTTRKASAVHPADVIGYVTPQQIRAAGADGLSIEQLDEQQRAKLPAAAPSTRVHFFPQPDGAYGIALISEPASVEALH